VGDVPDVFVVDVFVADVFVVAWMYLSGKKWQKKIPQNLENKIEVNKGGMRSEWEMQLEPGEHVLHQQNRPKILRAKMYSRAQ
jgi:hypothetical protein